jgi:hypothetical protein
MKAYSADRIAHEIAFEVSPVTTVWVEYGFSCRITRRQLAGTCFNPFADWELAHARLYGM